jgi:hypothetical protein
MNQEVKVSGQISIAFDLILVSPIGSSSSGKQSIGFDEREEERLSFASV